MIKPVYNKDSILFLCSQYYKSIQSYYVFLSSSPFSIQLIKDSQFFFKLIYIRQLLTTNLLDLCCMGKRKDLMLEFWVNFLESGFEKLEVAEEVELLNQGFAEEVRNKLETTDS